MTRPYLLGLKLAGRRVGVVGGGAVAQRRVGGLREAGAAVVGVSPSLTPALSDLGTAGRLERVPRPYADGDLAGARLVHGCTDDPAAQAAVVIADRLAPKALLAELPPDVEVVDAAKNPRGRAMAQDEINRLLVEHARAGRAVVRLKGGDPFVFGRGMEEVLACAAAGIEVTVVPGVSSVTGVPTAAGIPVTHRGLTQEFTVVSGHLPPGDPGSTVDWSRLAGAGTLVLLMAVDHRAAIAAALIAAGRDP